MSSARRKVGAVCGTSVLVGGASSALLLALAASPVGATGTTFTVDTLDDGAPQPTDCITPVPGSCSLRDALYATNDGDTVTFISGLTGTIHLSGTQLDIDDVIEIDGPGASSLTIDAGGISRVFYVCSSGAPATISGMTITGGRARKGAGVYEESCGGVILREVVISGNVATRYGGGVYANANLWIYDSEISGNQAPTYGGGVYAGSDLVIANSTIIDNQTTQSGNGGGGVFASGTTMIEFSTFARNSSAGAGGGLYFHGAAQPITITNSVFANNEAERGGGAFFDSSGPVVVANSTFTANSSYYGGGGLAIDGLASLLQVTIVGNRALGADAFDTGGGIHFSNSSTVNLSGAIVSGNTSANGADDMGTGNANSGPMGIASDNSLIGDVDARIVVNGTGNISSLDPMVGPLANNGGPTKTMALLPGSPAIDAGPNPVATFPGNRDDQRGNGFVRVYGGRVDIGAFEVQPMPEPTTTTTTPSGPVVPTFTG